MARALFVRTASLSVVLSLAGLAMAIEPSGAPGIRDIVSSGGGATLRLWRERDPAGSMVDLYTYQRAGGAWSQPAVEPHTLMLRYGQFDPTGQTPALPPSLAQAAGGDGAYIVQLHGQALPEFLDDLRAAGAEDLRFLPYSSYIVRVSEAGRVAIAAKPFVRAVVRYQPAYKIEEGMLIERFGWSIAAKRPAATKAAPAGEVRPYNIMVMRRGAEQQMAVARQIEKAGGRVDGTDFNGFVLRASLDREQIRSVAFMSEVLSIDPWSPPESDMDEQREMGGANYVEASTGFSGQGVRGELMDGGIRQTHIAFTPPPIIHVPSAPPVVAHGTNCYGIIFGTGAGNAAARGMLPSGTGVFGNYNNFSGGSRYVHTAELVNATYQCVFQSNSWGDATTVTVYNNTSAQMDDIIFINDFLICQSQSNTGTQNSRAQAWAKNIVSVGGINTQNTVSIADDTWTGASIGPAADGRLKPDLSNSYNSVLTTTSSNDSAYTSTFNGTSAATPIVAGHFGIFYQMWAAGLFGNPVSPGGSVFANRPHFATAKAMMINTARQYVFSGTTANLSRYKQGWGFPDLRQLYDLRNRMLVLNETQRLTVGQTYTTNLHVIADGTPLRITMVYKDPQGTTSASIHRINDLTLKVTSPNSTVYWGNNGLAAGNYSTAGGVANDRDTVENVFIQAPIAGTWTVQVIATEINQDGATDTPEMDATFALVASGVAPPGPAACSPADIASEGNSDIAAGPDGFVTGVDFDVFVTAYFTGFVTPGGVLLADITDSLGEGGPDGFVTGSDFDRFTQLYFAGCP